MPVISRKQVFCALLAFVAGCGGGDPTGPDNGSGGTGGTRLLVNINGLASSNPAAVSVTGPAGYTQTVTTTQTLTGLAPGTYTITAQTVQAGTSQYAASPATQDVVVSSGATTTSSVSYSAPPSGTFNLRIDRLYVTQSTQTLDGAVPLVAGRNGFLRVFVVANGTNVAQPTVRVRFYQDQVLQSEQTVNATGVMVPTAADESSLSYSWNIPVAASVIRPGLGILAEVDIGNSVAESNEADNAFPAALPQTMNVRTVPALNLMLVPVVQKAHAGRGPGNVSHANKEQYLDVIRRMHPLATLNTEVHAPYTTTTVDTLEDDNGNDAWATILNELDLLRTAERSSGYYYGVAKVSYDQGVAGVAYVSTPSARARVALGWDYLPSGALVAAHELGHNWGRNHAPCGRPGGLDTQYPHSDGSIGVYGFDVTSQSIKAPSSSDIMGYCEPKWIGDYNYKAIMDYLAPPSSSLTAGSDEAQPTLLVWGHVKNGEMVLEPAFQVTTHPKLPQRAGPYSIEATDADGASLFRVSFSPEEIADASGHQKNFVFAVPLNSAKAARLSTLRLSGPGRPVLVRTAAVDPTAGAQFRAGAKPDSVEVRSVGGSVALRWNARARPMVMVRDAATGEILSLARGGDVQLSIPKGEVDLVISDGIRSRVKRASVR